MKTLWRLLYWLYLKPAVLLEIAARGCGRSHLRWWANAAFYVYVGLPILKRCSHNHDVRLVQGPGFWHHACVLCDFVPLEDERFIAMHIFREKSTSTAEKLQEETES